MKFCKDHWDRLRSAIEERGLGDLIAPDGETAMAQTVDQLERAQRGDETETPANYDPLMGAHWAIVSNAMQTAGPSALYLMGGGVEDPVDPALYPNRSERKTWPRCPLCYVNLAHELTCTEAGCVLLIEHGFDWMIGRAADDQAEKVTELRKSSA